MKRSLIILFSLVVSITVSGKDYDVSDFGAVNDGKTINTVAIQRAIDLCSVSGGGRVMLTGGGRYATGTLYIKSYVTLYIDNGTTLLGSNRIDDYSTDTHKNMYKDEIHMNRCLLFAKDAKSIAIEGHGTIDGNGNAKDSFFIETRPMMIRFINCSNIHVTDINLLNPAAWTSAWLYCNDISVSGIKIESRVNGNGDGLDFDGCSNVRVSNSIFDNSDDCICLQTSRPDKPCHDITITNCVFTTQWGGMRIGLLSRGDFYNVTVSNCTFHDIHDSGLKIQMNEGGSMRNMIFTNLIMQNVPRPIFMTFCKQRACTDAPMELAPMKEMRSFIFQNIIVDNAELDKNSCLFLTGLPDHYIEDVMIRDVQILVKGGAIKEDSVDKVKEYTPEVLGNWWPEFYLVGTLPACGIYARHIKGLTLENIHVKTVDGDARKPFVTKDVEYYNAKGLVYNYRQVIE